MFEPRLNLNEPFVADRTTVAREMIDDIDKYVGLAKEGFPLTLKGLIVNPISTINMFFAFRTAAKVLHEMKDIKVYLLEAKNAKDFSDTHELLCELNDLLAEQKDLLIKLFEIPAKGMKVDGVELFGALTYGGRV